MEPLFPELPEDLAKLSDEEIADLLQRHEVAADLIDAEDEEFTKGLSADDVIVAYKAGVEQMKAIKAEQDRREQAQERYLAEKEALAAERKALRGEQENADSESEALAAEGEDGDEKDEEEDEESEAEEEAAQVEEGEAVVAAAESERPVPVLRRPPQPSPERQLREKGGTYLTAASGLDGVRGGTVLDRLSLASAMKTIARRLGPPAKSEAGIEQRFFIAQAVFPFPEERRLMPGEPDTNAKKIQAVVPAGVPGLYGNPSLSYDALTASGGLCAPLEPIYTMPNFATQARPVRDSLPSFQAERGGVNVPTATDIGDITTAITTIEEADDALGGTFATKSCQDLTCPDYTEVPVTIISHCREYGNLNARAWPEKIAHENDLTMAAHARTAEGYLLDRIRALSVVVDVAQVIGAYADLARALSQAAAGIRYRLRMEEGAVFRVLAPEWLLDLLAADTASTQFDRFQGRAQMDAHLRSLGFAPAYYKDAVTAGVSQAFADQVADGLDPFPDDAQIAVFPEGEFIHVDSGTLDLGIVRDSTLNSTNDFQVFGESFENVARLGPPQGALWLNVGLCPSGEFPALDTAYSCA